MSDMLRNFVKEIPDVEVVGLVDANPEVALRRLPEGHPVPPCFNSLADLVAKSKPDALAIGTRCDTHARFAIEASRYAIPLFLEKPIATNLEDAIALERAFENSRCRVLVSFPLRVSPLCVRARKLIEQGAVGRVEHMTGLNYVPYGDVYFNSWYRDYSVTQGLFLQKATHDFDYMAYLAGSQITNVAAMVSKGRAFRDKMASEVKDDPFALYAENIGTPETGMNEDSSSALVQFANGAQGIYTQVFYAKRDAARRGPIVSGFVGTLEFDWYRNELKCIHHHEPFTDITKAADGTEHFGGDTILAKNFGSMVGENAASRAPLHCGLQSVYACLAAKVSAETGQFAKVRQIGE